MRAGAPKPDIRTVDAFRRALVDAKSVTFQSTSAIYLYLTTTLLPKLGIADLVARKSNDAGPPAVASGAVELAIQPISELVHAQGIDCRPLWQRPVLLLLPSGANKLDTRGPATAAVIADDMGSPLKYGQLF